MDAWFMKTIALRRRVYCWYKPSVVTSADIGTVARCRHYCAWAKGRHFSRVGPISHFQRRIVLDVVMSCVISSYLFFYSKPDGANSCHYAWCFTLQCSALAILTFIILCTRWYFLKLFCFVNAFSHTGAPYINIGSMAPLCITFSARCPIPHLSLSDFANMFTMGVHFPVM